MDMVMLIEPKNYERVRGILMRNELISKASVSFKEASITGKEGYYLYMSGTEEQCKEVKKIADVINSFAGAGVIRDVKGDEKDQVIDTIKEEETKAMEGFGSIFG